MSAKVGDLYNVEVSHGEFMALSNYENKPVICYHLLQLKFKLLLPLFLIFFYVAQIPVRLTLIPHEYKTQSSGRIMGSSNIYQLMNI